MRKTEGKEYRYCRLSGGQLCGMLGLERVYGESMVHCAREGHITLTVVEQGFK